MAQTLPSRDFSGTAGLPLKPDIGWRGWHVRKVPKAGVNGERDFGWRDLQDKTARSEFFLMPLSSRSKNIFIENSALREA
jgi:hypothetical protein